MATALFRIGLIAQGVVVGGEDRRGVATSAGRARYVTSNDTRTCPVERAGDANETKNETEPHRKTPPATEPGAFLQVSDLLCSWAGAESNRRPSTFLADRRAIVRDVRRWWTQARITLRLG